MSQVSGRRRLVVNADDFGRSSSINSAVLRAHTQGILTTASLMVNEPACDEAVHIAKAHPRLGVGLHLSLTCGRTGLSAHEIPALADAIGAFRSGPIAAGLRYFFRASIKTQLRAEIHEQFRRFHATGLRLDHVNGHLHIHLHPTVLSILLEEAEALGIRSVRAGRDPLFLNLKLARGQLGYRLSHALIFGILCARARNRLRSRKLAFTPHTFGLLQDSRVDERFICSLLPHLPPGTSELYSHPCIEHSIAELEALTSLKVRKIMDQEQIELMRYQDLV